MKRSRYDMGGPEDREKTEFESQQAPRTRREDGGHLNVYENDVSFRTATTRARTVGRPAVSSENPFLRFGWGNGSIATGKNPFVLTAPSQNTTGNVEKPQVDPVGQTTSFPKNSRPENHFKRISTRARAGKQCENPTNAFPGNAGGPSGPWFRSHKIPKISRDNNRFKGAPNQYGSPGLKHGRRVGGGGGGGRPAGNTFHYKDHGDPQATFAAFFGNSDPFAEAFTPGGPSLFDDDE